MASNKQSVQFPPLRIPNPKIADPGKVRLGDTDITAQFPPLACRTQRLPIPARFASATAVSPRSSR
jgi:hypothetical protein